MGSTFADLGVDKLIRNNITIMTYRCKIGILLWKQCASLNLMPPRQSASNTGTTQIHPNTCSIGPLDCRKEDWKVRQSALPHCFTNRWHPCCPNFHGCKTYMKNIQRENNNLYPHCVSMTPFRNDVLFDAEKWHQTCLEEQNGHLRLVIS